MPGLRELLAVGLCCLTSLAFAAEQRLPNVVFILADDLGINDLSCYGRMDQATPRLDRLASEGMRFTSAYCAQPICSPSRAAIMSGLSPARLHITTFLPGRGDAPSQKLLHPKINMQLALEHTTLAEHLKAAGYATACIGKWHLGGAGFGPKEQGFDVVHAGKANTQPTADEGGKGEYDLTAHAIDFVRANQDKPFFLYLPHNNPHIPLAAKPELIETFKSSFNPTYAAVVNTLDDCVGRLLDELDELKLRDNTLVVFTSDNGGVHLPELKEDAPTHNTPFRAGKGYLYEGGLRIPLIVRLPDVVPAGKVSDTPVINTDWLPTILDLCGVEFDATKSDGVSIAPLLKGDVWQRGHLMWHFPHYNNQGGRPAGAIRAGDWKLIEHYEDGRVELFNLANDPAEEHNVAVEGERSVVVLRPLLARWRKSVGAQENTPNENFDPAWHKRLYQDFDSSRLKPDATAAAMRNKLAAWRAGMDAVVAKPKK
jgi:arylsulfatase A-like enzyme